MRRIDSVPRWAYPFAALLLMASCLLISLLPRSTGGSIQSAKSILQTIPLYPGATHVYHEDTDTPGSKLVRQLNYCEFECARVTYEAPERRGTIARFYQQWALVHNWRQWPEMTTGNWLTPSFEYGASVFQGWGPDSRFPWISAKYEVRRDYNLVLTTEENIRGITSIELTLQRLTAMASDTPLPTLVPPPTPPPTIPIPIPPGSVRTRQPNLPPPVPTTP